MLNVAKENNLAETAFCMRRGGGLTAADSEPEADAVYDIRTDSTTEYLRKI